ncbi:hypothetical protein BV22DRAFT_1135883 [Leucogyrophana mollusca]|uniref:Uncharacterized protein n=1 Tax=Leucogyrophana mollusca TaxID=85980 RepID=A0ACB8AU87_9AGAM|nr:hypothetical protein BV22DRAFT_1135883 [Leucogyrophana mollusca]
MPQNPHVVPAHNIKARDDFWGACDAVKYGWDGADDACPSELLERLQAAIYPEFLALSTSR